MTGFVYAMVSGENAKIGWSEKPQLRVVKVRSDTPCDVRLIGFVEATRQQELEIQEMLKPWRVFGEWFQMSARAVAAFVDDLRGRGMPGPSEFSAIASKLEIYLKENSLNDSQFALLVGRNQSTVCRWRKPGARPDHAAMKKIFEVTNGAVTPNDFLASPPAPSPAHVEPSP